MLSLMNHPESRDDGTVLSLRMTAKRDAVESLSNQENPESGTLPNDKCTNPVTIHKSA